MSSSGMTVEMVLPNAFQSALPWKKPPLIFDFVVSQDSHPAATKLLSLHMKVSPGLKPYSPQSRILFVQKSQAQISSDTRNHPLCVEI